MSAAAHTSAALARSPALLCRPASARPAPRPPPSARVCALGARRSPPLVRAHKGEEGVSAHGADLSFPHVASDVKRRLAGVVAGHESKAGALQNWCEGGGSACIVARECCLTDGRPSPACLPTNNYPSSPRPAFLEQAVAGAPGSQRRERRGGQGAGGDGEGVEGGSVGLRAQAQLAATARSVRPVPSLSSTCLRASNDRWPRWRATSRSCGSSAWTSAPGARSRGAPPPPCAVQAATAEDGQRGLPTCHPLPLGCAFLLCPAGWTAPSRRSTTPAWWAVWGEGWPQRCRSGCHLSPLLHSSWLPSLPACVSGGPAGGARPAGVPAGRRQAV